MSSIEGLGIEVGTTFTFSSSGREYTPSGTEGQFDLNNKANTKIGSFYWNCPFTSSANTWKITDQNIGYNIISSEAHLTGGALGNIAIGVYNRA